MKKQMKPTCMKAVMSATAIFSALLFSCAQNSGSAKQTNLTSTKKNMKEDTTHLKATGVATFANGCFWCTEAVFEELNGVISAESGYSGGHTKNPTYKEVSYDETGHAECLQIIYDTSVITFDELLERARFITRSK